jgi:hypothetical protein
VSEPFGGPLPDDIALTRREAASILLALDEAAETTEGDLRRRLEAAATTIIDKLLPDLPEL